VLSVTDNIVYLETASKPEAAMKYDSLTLERLKEVLHYDPETGIFTWKVRPVRNSRKHPGDQAGGRKGKGYLYIGIDSRQYLGSQLAWLYHYGTWAKGEVGVKDGNPANLRIDNLYEFKTVVGDHDLSTKDGRSAYRKAQRLANPEIYRGYGFKRYYGISTEDYQRMFLEQRGVCAICEQPETANSPWGEKKWLSVDHCHDSKAVRGLLCASCNHMLGHGRDNPDILRRAADYLEKANSTICAKGKAA